MDITLSGIIMFVRPLQPENALPPMDVTLSGIVIPVRLQQPENAASGIIMRPSGNTTFPEISPQTEISSVNSPLYRIPSKI